jgi:long-subunit fatty acid transport protein
VQFSKAAVLCGCVLVSTTLVVQQARAGNEETYFLDSDAALAAGAVAASSVGAGSVWYNPAGLAGADRSHINLSLSVASMQVRDYRDAIRVTRADGSVARQSLDGTRIALLSPAVSYVLKLPDVTLGAGLFTTRDDVLKVSAASSYADDAGRTSLVQTTLDTAVTRYHLGGGVGFTLPRKLHFGASLFGVYEGVETHANIALSLEDPTQTPSFSSAATASWRDQSWRVGMQGAAGLRYEPLERWSLGLVVRTPLVLVHESVEASTLMQTARNREPGENGAAAPTISSAYDAHPRRAARFGMAAPARFAVGVAYRTPRGFASIEADYAHALRSLDVANGARANWLVDRKTVFNVRAGMMMRVSRVLELGGGLYTDRAPERRAQSLGDTKVDYYGGTLGLRISKFLATAQQGASAGLVFQTTLALRYAAGTGSAGGLRYGLNEPDNPTSSEARARVLFHELHVYLGSGVAY